MCLSEYDLQSRFQSECSNRMLIVSSYVSLPRSIRTHYLRARQTRRQSYRCPMHKQYIGACLGTDNFKRIVLSGGNEQKMHRKTPRQCNEPSRRRDRLSKIGWAFMDVCREFELYRSTPSLHHIHESQCDLIVARLQEACASD